MVAGNKELLASAIDGEVLFGASSILKPISSKQSVNMVSEETLAASVQRPCGFKNPNWKAPNRRHKPYKQLVSDEQKRLNNAEKPLPVDAVTYFSVEAYPSLKPKKHYCDITGLQGRYKVPSNGLRFHNSEVYDIIKHMAQGVDQQYLELRNANVVLK